MILVRRDALQNTTAQTLLAASLRLETLTSIQCSLRTLSSNVFNDITKQLVSGTFTCFRVDVAVVLQDQELLISALLRRLHESHKSWQSAGKVSWVGRQGRGSTVCQITPSWELERKLSRSASEPRGSKVRGCCVVYASIRRRDCCGVGLHLTRISPSNDSLKQSRLQCFDADAVSRH